MIVSEDKVLTDVQLFHELLKDEKRIQLILSILKRKRLETVNQIDRGHVIEVILKVMRQKEELSRNHF